MWGLVVAKVEDASRNGQDGT
jgi:hypothetical protein